jgi:membrane protein
LLFGASTVLVELQDDLNTVWKVMPRPGRPIWEILRERLLSFAVITLLFAMIYKVLPDAEVAWRDVWVGAILTALLFTAGKYLIGLYLGHSTLTSAFGAAGSVILLLTWVYYSALILLFGAEFTRACARHSGSPMRPKPHAIPRPCPPGAEPEGDGNHRDDSAAQPAVPAGH